MSSATQGHPLPENDMVVLLGCLSYVEGALAAPEDDVMPALVRRLKTDLTRLGLSPNEDDAEILAAVRAMNARLRLSLGE